jgi:uncharacterized protein with GYD domain
MATYILLVNFTDQGVRNVKKSPERAKAAFAAAENLGVKVKEAYWTLGAHDAVLVAESPDAETVTAWALGLGSLGNVRTQTMRAFTADEVNKIITKVP